jgi:hypothetical protein
MDMNNEDLKKTKKNWCLKLFNAENQTYNVEEPKELESFWLLRS